MGRDGYACPRNGAGTNMPSHQRSLVIIQYCAVNVVRFLEVLDLHWIWIPTLLFERLPILWVYLVQGCFLKMRLCDSAESLAAMPECGSAVAITSTPDRCWPLREVRRRSCWPFLNTNLYVFSTFHWSQVYGTEPYSLLHDIFILCETKR